MSAKNEFVGWLKEKGFGRNQTDINECYDLLDALIKSESVKLNTPPLSAEQVLTKNQILMKWLNQCFEPSIHFDTIGKIEEAMQEYLDQFRNQGITLPSDVEIDQMYPLTYLNDGVYLDDHMARAARRGAKEMRNLIQQQLNGK